MSENASGQLLGYAIQFPRALCHLLKALPGAKVCIEVHGDVATITSTGEVVAEEDKSSVSSNPVTDKSTDLWKTLSNWVNGVLSGEFDVNTTTFVLYRNKSGRKGLVDAFDTCTTRAQAEQVLLNAEAAFADVDDTHAIWPYYKNAAIDHPEILAELITRFQLETGEGAGFDEVALVLRTMKIPASQRRAVTHHLSGWLVKSTMELISQRKPAVFTYEEFEHECTVIFSRARYMELLDFTTHAPVSQDEIEKEIRNRPTYLRQIELIEAEDDDFVEAVTDFLKAKTNRDKWIEDELIDEQVAEEFESNLRRFWKNKRTEVRLVHSNLDKEARGLLLLSQCQTHQETIRNVKPPPSTIAGTYHALADKAHLGWHEDWESEFKK